MSHKLREDDPIFYKIALKGLIAQAEENGVNVSLKLGYVVFDDEKDGITTTSCGVEIKSK